MGMRVNEKEINVTQHGRAERMVAEKDRKNEWKKEEKKRNGKKQAR